MTREVARHAVALLIAAIFPLFGCATRPNNDSTSSFYRDSMHAFVVGIAQQAEASQPFFVVAQNGEGLLVANDPSETASITAYADALDGMGCEDLFYG